MGVVEEFGGEVEQLGEKLLPVDETLTCYQCVLLLMKSLCKHSNPIN